APVLGQTTSGGSVRGVVRDEQGAAVRGAAITATSATAPETYTTASDAEGHYRFTNLPPGDYRIVVVLERFTTLVREPIVVRAGMTIGLDLDLKVGAVADTIEVVGDTPLLERTLPSQAVNIDGELQRSLPTTPRRHWTDFLLVTPGVTAATLATQRMLYFVHGSGYDSQVSLVDGAEVNPARQDYAGGVNFSTESMADVQVTTVGASASTPLGVGAVVNAVTKSGTNRFAGSATLTWQPLRWNANNLPGGTSTKSAVFQPEIGAGGPIRRDRAWFYASYRRNNYEEGLDRTPPQLAALSALSPGFAPFNRTNNSSFYFGKITAAVAGNHRIQGLYKYDLSPLDAVSNDSAATYAQSQNGGHAASVQWNSIIGRHAALKATASVNRFLSSTTLARVDVPRRTVFGTTNLVSGRRRGVGQLAILDNVSSHLDAPSVRSAVSADVTLFDIPHLARHEIQVGVYWQGLDVQTETRYVNQGFVLEELVLRDPSNVAGGTVPFRRQIYDGDRARTLDAEGRDIAAYIQDVWRLGSATISAGVRVDRIRQRDRLFGLQTQRSTAIGPRVGINLGIPGDERATLHAAWARRHDGVASTLLSSGTNTLGFRDLYDLDLDGTFETTFVTPASTALFQDRQFDPDRHQPFVDDLAIGYGRQIGGATTLDGTYIHRAFRDRVAFVEINGIYTGDVFNGYRNPALNDIYLVTNNRWNSQIYDALELRASHATATLQLIASYTRQWRHLDGTWQPNDPASFLQPDAFENTKGIGNPRGLAAAFEANSLSGLSMVQYTGVSQWQDHVVNLGASIQGPWRLIFSTTYNLASGPWSGPVVTRLAAPDPAFGPPTLTLPNGRLVSNPLATTLRFQGSDRSEGQFTPPPLHVWNIRLGRVIEVRGAKIEASINILNVLNGDTDLDLAPSANQVFSPAYRTFASRQTPRAGQVFVRVLF
ncbi:MAG TPA: TonB-dependent receptor, partial [Vicinamibacterales bacterium]